MAVCPRCGRTLPDGYKFCDKCGIRIDAVPSAPQNGVQGNGAASSGGYNPGNPGNYGNQAGGWNAGSGGNFGGAAAGGSYGVPEDQGKAGKKAKKQKKAKQDGTPGKKKTGKKVAIGIAIVAVLTLVVGGVLFALHILSGSGEGGIVLAYFSDGEYLLLKDPVKGEPIELDSTDADTLEEYHLAFTPDGKYIYYFIDVDQYGMSGTLCRAEVEKLKTDSDDNDEYIEIIDRDVVPTTFLMLDDSSVLYSVGTNKPELFYLEDGKEPVQIEKSAMPLAAESKRLIYIMEDLDSSGDEFSLGAVDLNDIGSKRKLDSGIENILDSFDDTAIYPVFNEYYRIDVDDFVYQKWDENGRPVYYHAGFDQNPEMILADAEAFPDRRGTIYFVSSSDKTMSLYDFVEDPHAAEDAGITEPDSYSFRVPQYNYEMVYGSDLSESDFDKLYTTCTKALYWFGESTWDTTSMDWAVGYDWGDETEDILDAVQDFMDRFAADADENGYILVTDEVKAALQKINDAAGKEDWKWLWLCYNKYQSGSIMDTDAYEEASAKWDEAKDRIALREALQDPENDIELYTISVFRNGRLTTVSDTALSVYYNLTESVIFNTPEMLGKIIQLEDVTEIQDVVRAYKLDFSAENYLALGDGTACRMSAEAAKEYARARDAGSTYEYFMGNEMFLLTENGDLSAAPISNGVIGKFDLIASDAEILDFQGTTLYYASECDERNSVTVGDLYSYTGGQSTLLAEGVIMYRAENRHALHGG